MHRRRDGIEAAAPFSWIEICFIQATTLQIIGNTLAASQISLDFWAKSLQPPTFEIFLHLQ